MKIKKNKKVEQTFTITMNHDEMNAIASALSDLGDAKRGCHIVYDVDDDDVVPRNKTRKIYTEFASMVDEHLNAEYYDYFDWFKMNPNKGLDKSL